MLQKRSNFVKKFLGSISFLRTRYNRYGEKVRTTLKPYKPHISARVFYFGVLLSSISISFVLKDRYSGHWLKTVLNRNLPALGQLQKKISWETFETVMAEQLLPNSETNLLSLNESLAVERIDLYSDFMIIKVNPIWNKLVSQKFVGVLLAQKEPFNEINFSTLNGINSHWYKIPARSVVNPLITLHMKNLTRQPLEIQDIKQSITPSSPIFSIKETLLTYAEEIPNKLDSLSFGVELSGIEEKSTVENLSKKGPNLISQEKSNVLIYDFASDNDLSFAKHDQSSIGNKTRKEDKITESIGSKASILQNELSFKDRDLFLISSKEQFRVQKGLNINNDQHILNSHSLIGLSLSPTFYELFDEKFLEGPKSTISDTTKGCTKKKKKPELDFSFEDLSSSLESLKSLGEEILRKEKKVETGPSDRATSSTDKTKRKQDRAEDKEYMIGGFDSLSTTYKSLFYSQGALPPSELPELDDIVETDDNEDISQIVGESLLNIAEEFKLSPLIEAIGGPPDIALGSTKGFNRTTTNKAVSLLKNLEELLNWGQTITNEQITLSPKSKISDIMPLHPIFENNAWLKPRLMSGYLFLDSDLFSLLSEINTKSFLKSRFHVLSDLLQNNFHLPLEIPLPPTSTSSSPFERTDLESPQLDILYKDMELKGSKSLKEALQDVDVEKGLKEMANKKGLLGNKSSDIFFKKIDEQDILQQYRELLGDQNIDKTSIVPYFSQNSQNFKKPFSPFNIRAYPDLFYKGLAFFPDLVTQDLDTDDNGHINPWVASLLGSDNFFSDKKSDFFGKKIVLRSKFPRFEQKAIRKRFLVPLELSSSFSSIKKPKHHPSFSRDSLYKTYLSTPSKRYLDLPCLTPSEWYGILKAELNLHLVDEAVEASIFRSKAENLKKEYKMREITVFVPSIGMRKAREEAVEWPLTKIEYKQLGHFWFPSKISSFHLPLDSKNENHNKKNDLQLFSLIGTRHVIHFNPDDNDPWTFFKTKWDKSKVLNLRFRIQPKVVQTKIMGHTIPRIHLHSRVPNVRMDSVVYGYLPEDASLSFNKSNHFVNRLKGSQISQIQPQGRSPIRFFNLESITPSSWLALYQIVIGLWVLQAAKYLYRVALKGILLSFLKGLTHFGIDSRQIIKSLTEIPPRIVFQPNRRFQDVAGIDNIVPELGELVWFLRNSGRDDNTPRGLLLVGPPGTGKTFLIQAIAGEAQVPVICESVNMGSYDLFRASIGDIESKSPLEHAFRIAQRQAPCILFLDEIDSIGTSREGVITNSLSRDGIVDLLHGSQPSIVDEEALSLIPQPQVDEKENQREDLLMVNLQEKHEVDGKRVALLGELLKEMDGLRALKGVIVIGATNRPDALDPALLRPGRFERIIDLGLPGRGKRIDILKLYSKNIGVTIPVSTSNDNESTYWNYLAACTTGLTAADLAAAMKHSAIQAIIQNTSHTIETMESGLDSILGYSEQTIKNQNIIDKDYLSLNRLAYYQAGKAVVHTKLPLHPDIALLRLRSDSKKSFRTNSLNLTQSVGTGRRLDFETRLIGFYAGKAAELLLLSCKERTSKDLKSKISTKQKNISLQSSVVVVTEIKGVTRSADFIEKQISRSSEQRTTSWAWQSDLGFAELFLASSLAHLMIDKWYFYSQNNALRKVNQIDTERNAEELKDTDTITLLEQLSKKYRREEVLLRRTAPDSDTYQQWSLPSWWQKQASRQTQFGDRSFAEWYRVYLPRPEENLRNDEWLPADQYYHQATNIQDLSKNPSLSSGYSQRLYKNSCEASSKSITFGLQEFEAKQDLASQKVTTSFKVWNEFYLLDRDYTYQSLVTACFNKAFSLLDENRELLDALAYYLLRLHTLRQHEILQILLNFTKNPMEEIEKELNKIDTTPNIQKEKNLSLKQKKQVVIPDLILQPGETLPLELSNVEIIEKYWGSLSRQNAPRFINFSFIRMRYQ